MRSSLRSWLTSGLSLLLLVLLWVMLSRVLDSPYMTPLGDVLEAFRRNWLFTRVLPDVVPSLWRMTGGYLLGVAVGVVVGCILGRIRVLGLAFAPTIEFVRSIPPIAIIPAFVIVIGTGDLSKVLIIALGATMPVLMNTFDGVRSVDPTLSDYSRVFRLRRRERISIAFRSASPQIFAGARTALAIAFILMVTSEMMASTNGIGYFVLISQRTFAVPDMWSGILLLGFLGALFNMIFVLLERGLLAWYRGYKSLQQSGE